MMIVFYKKNVLVAKFVTISNIINNNSLILVKPLNSCQSLSHRRIPGSRLAKPDLYYMSCDIFGVLSK